MATIKIYRYTNRRGEAVFSIAQPYKINTFVVYETELPSFVHVSKRLPGDLVVDIDDATYYLSNLLKEDGNGGLVLHYKSLHDGHHYIPLEATRRVFKKTF